MPGGNVSGGRGQLAGGADQRCAMGADQRFQKRIARQAIGSVQSRAGNFAEGVKAFNIRFAIHGCAHSAALVVRRGHNRNRLARDIDAVLEAGLIILESAR